VSLRWNSPKPIPKQGRRQERELQGAPAVLDHSRACRRVMAPPGQRSIAAR
jgi:hypothetical protein